MVNKLLMNLLPIRYSGLSITSTRYLSAFIFRKDENYD
jgi:hypothetical protein